MKQLLLRVPDETHARVTEQARQAGLSVNAWANRLLELGIDPDAASRRDRLRLRLLELGPVGRRPAPSQDVSEPPGRAAPRAQQPDAPSTPADRDALLELVRADLTSAAGEPEAFLSDALDRAGK